LGGNHRVAHYRQRQSTWDSQKRERSEGSSCQNGQKNWSCPRL